MTHSMILNFRRTNASTRLCTFPNCKTSMVGLRNAKYSKRYRALKMLRMYIPKGARFCKFHFNENSWNSDMPEENGIFSKVQIEDLITLVTEKKEVKSKRTVVGPDNTNTMDTYIGLNSEQFENVLNIVLPSLLTIYQKIGIAKNALYIFLMKLRTGFTIDEICPFFDLTKKTMIQRIRNVRQIMYKEFVPRHLFNWTRQDLLENTSPLSRELYNVDENTAVITFDGTYVYTIISSNYGFQKDSYSIQKKRNLVKFMMCVSTNGLILGAYRKK